MPYKKYRAFENKKRWIAEINIYSKLQNPFWIVNEQNVKRIIKICRELPYHTTGIPQLNETQTNGCKLSGPNDSVIHSFGRIILIYKKNIIAIKEDIDFTVENEILKSAPERVYKKIYFYI